MKNPSPLFVWKLLFIATLGGGLFLYLVDPMPVVFEHRDIKMERAVQSANFKDGETGIIFFGNSLMNHALPPITRNLNALLEKELQKRKVNFPKVAALDIATGGVRAPRLHGFADDFIRARPAVVVLQSEMFVSRSRKRNEPWSVSARTRLAQWSGILQLRLFGVVANPPDTKVKHDFLQSNQQNAKVKESRHLKTEESLIRAREFWNNHVASIDDPIFVQGKQLVDRFEKAGIEVIVVELPVSRMAAELTSPNYLQDRRRVLQDLKQVGASIISYPNLLPNDYFTDYSHLNHKGRLVFLRWFGPALAEELAKL